MSDRPTPDGDDAASADAPTVEPTDPFANLPKPRPGLEIRSPSPERPAPSRRPDTGDHPSPEDADVPPRRREP